MMEFFMVVKEWWLEYYPMVVGVVTAIGTALGVVVLVWSKVKPVLDSIKDLKGTVEDKASTISPLEMLKASSMATDLKAKLENPTIPDSLKLEYQSQLYELDKLIGTANSITEKASDITGKF